MFSPATLYILRLLRLFSFFIFGVWTLFFLGETESLRSLLFGNMTGSFKCPAVGPLTRCGKMSGRCSGASLNPGRPSFRPGTQLEPYPSKPSAPANSLPSPPCLQDSPEKVRQLKPVCRLHVCSVIYFAMTTQLSK